MEQLAELTANGLVTGSIIAMGAIGVSLVYGTLRIINLAHGDYMTVGAFAAFLANVSLGLGMVVSIALAVIATALVGLLLEYVLWRPLRNRGATVIALFITSLGLALVLRNLLFMGFGAGAHHYDVNVVAAHALGPVRLSTGQLIAVAVAVVSIVAVGLLLARTRMGREMRAVSENEALATVSGIDVKRVTICTWLVGSGLAGLGGVMQALVQGSFNPNLGFALLLLVFAAVVLGGVGSAYGALVGGLVVGIVMEVSTWEALAGGVDPVYKPVVAFSVLIALLLIRPQGLFGRVRLT